MGSVTHRRWLIGLLLSLALSLLGIVDVRRGFLFSAYRVRTPFLVLHPWHAAILAVGLAGVYASYRRLQALERRSPAAMPYRTNVLAALVAALLALDLLTYRLVPAARTLASGRLGVEWLDGFGITNVWRPMALATSYLGTVWHATLLGILLAGLAQTAFPVSFAPRMSRGGVRGSILGSLFALPQPFCSCCASSMVPPLVRHGASLPFLLAFVVGSPMLNVTTLVLAGALLPPSFALARIVGGVLMTVVITYVVARVAADRRPGDAAERPDAPREGWLFGSTWEAGDRDRLSSDLRPDTPARLLRAWLRASGRLALVVVPTLWVSSVVAAALFQFLPSLVTNTVLGVVLASVVGAFFMVSTWSEIAMVLPLIQAGLDGPAAALLIVLPATSLPSLVILGGAFQRATVAVLLLAAVMLAGMAAGILFL